MKCSAIVVVYIAHMSVKFIYYASNEMLQK